MAWMIGEPLVSKLAVLSKYFVLPAAMAAAVIYSPPDFATEKPKSSSSSSS
nr:DNA helicase [Ipomoea trifida]GMD40303.1 DNA helicase [Ipomoea batatas]GMD41975.1 DNA helicase [Ipomoea batatas]GMD43561.1 DNA helicase [Ipomoea batatas]GMD46678.1 DNA helicase [Ipomoea batatas]